MEFVTTYQPSFLTVISLLIAVIATVTVPKLKIPLVAKQITVNPLIRFFLYFAIAFMTVKVIAFAMVAAVFAILATYALELFLHDDKSSNTEEQFTNQQDTVNDVQTDNTDDTNYYLDDISEMSTGYDLNNIRKNDGTNIQRISANQNSSNDTYSNETDVSVTTQQTDNIDNIDNIVGYDTSNKYASV